MVNSEETPEFQQPAFTEEQLESLKALIAQGVSAAVTAARGADTQQGQEEKGEHPTPTGSATRTEPGPANNTDGEGPQEGQPVPEAPEPGAPGDPSPDGGGEDDASSDPSYESEESDTEIEAFTRMWHKRNRFKRTPPRFVVPPRFDPLLPVGFKPTTVEQYQNFCTGNATIGREGEAASLYCTASYTTVVNNTVVQALEDFIAVVETLPDDVKRPVAEAVDKVSDAQVATFGACELAASRYEVSLGRQGATGVADPELLSAYIDPPAAYSIAGRQAVRSAAQQAGKCAVGRGKGTAKPQSGSGGQPVTGTGNKGSGGGKGGKGSSRGGKQKR